MEPAYLQVPLLLCGEVIPDSLRGTQNPKVGSHVDLAVTLLRQLGLDSAASVAGFNWSKDMLNPYAPAFAYFETYTGYGWVRPQGAFTEVKSGNRWQVEGYGDSTIFPLLQKEGRAYLQKLYQSYCKY